MMRGFSSKLGAALSRAVSEIRRPKRVLAVTLVSATLLSGCGFHGMYDMPLPGGAAVGDHPYTVKVRFKDVLDLVPNSGVRVNDVPVGRVQTIGLAKGSWDAEVTVVVNGDVKLPSNSTARLRQSSLLGEKYVELAAPPDTERPVGRLANESVIGVNRTGRNPEVEEVLGALSLLLNGGGVGQLQNITRELNAAMSGRESDMRHLLTNLDTLVKGLDAQRGDITRALDSMNRLTATLNSQRGKIDMALQNVEPGIRVLNEQRGQLVTMLKSLDQLSSVSTDVVNRSKDDTVHNLRDLQPTLRKLAQAGSNLPKSFELLLTYPFPDSAAQGVKGDYMNLYVNMDLNLSSVLDNLKRGPSPLPPPPGTPQLPLLPAPPGQTPLLPAPPPAGQQPAPPPPPKCGVVGSLFGGC